MAWQKGVEQRIPFSTYKDGIATAPVNPLATISKDGAAFGACDNAVVHIADGGCNIIASAAEMNMDAGLIIVTSDTTDPEHIPIVTEAAYTSSRATAIDTIAADVVNIDGSAMRGTDDALLAADARIDTIAGDVAGLDGEAMRGTDDALLAADARITAIDANALLTRKLAEADYKTEIVGGEYQVVWLEKGTETEIARAALLDINGDPVEAIDTPVAGELQL